MGRPEMGGCAALVSVAVRSEEEAGAPVLVSAGRVIGSGDGGTGSGVRFEPPSKRGRIGNPDVSRW
jgi:hypothetical protein